MSFDRIGLPTGTTGVDLHKEPLLPDNKKSTSATAASTGLKERLQQFKSGISGLPGKIAGHFPSLCSSSYDVKPKLVASSPKAQAVEVAPPSDAQEKIQLAIDAEIAAFPYHRSLDKISQASQLSETHTEANSATDKNLGNWDTARPLALAAGKAAGLSTKGSDGFIYDEKSGLTAYVLQNPSAKPNPEVRLVFGGTTSGIKTGGLAKRSLLNGGFTLKQWIANAKNAVFGTIPDSYKQASELTGKLQAMMALDPQYKDFTLTVSGHSKGGGEASYAALSQKEPVHAICFSSAELGKQMQASIPEETKANAASFVSHYYVEGDAVPVMSKNALIKRLGGQLGHLGTIATLPADSKSASGLDRHDKFTRHIQHFAKPQDVSKSDG